MLILREINRTRRLARYMIMKRLRIRLISFTNTWISLTQIQHQQKDRQSSMPKNKKMQKFLRMKHMMLVYTWEIGLTD